MKNASNNPMGPLGFSLAEVLAALTIGSMVLVVVLSIYSQVETAATAITRKLDGSQLPFEVLQCIAEDVDRIVEGGADTSVTIENKFEKGYQSARLVILRTISDSKGKARTFEEIIWQTAYDYENDANGLVLYRSYSGMGLEDKLLDEQRHSWEKEYPFVPICDGVTFFKIEVRRGDYALDEWTPGSLPPGIIATISFAEPFEALDGTLDVLDVEKITQTIAVDRTRKIGFMLVKKEYDSEEEGEDSEEEGEDSEEEGEDSEEEGEDSEEVGKDEEEVSKEDKEEDNEERRSK